MSLVEAARRKVMEQTNVELGLGLLQVYPYQELLALIELAEASGYRILWCGNEKFYRDMWVTLGVVAAHARQAKVGTFIAEPYTYHPVMIAAAIATASEAARRDAILLLGAGGVGFPQMGLERHKPLTAIRETLSVARNLLAGKTVTYEGEVISTYGARLDFPVPDNVPIWVATRGDKTLQMAGELADGVMVATYARPTGVRHALRQIEVGAARVGRSLADLPVTLRVDVSLDDDAGAARAAVRPMIAGMIKASFPEPRFVRHAGLEVVPELAQELQIHEFSDLSSVADHLPPSFIDAFAWAGTPTQVAKQVAAVLHLGIRRITILPHATPDSSNQEIVRRFAQEVIPDALATAGLTD